MRRPALLFALLLAPALRLAAQAPPATLDKLAFMAGCWSGPAQMRGGVGALEERWTPPSANAMQGMSRWLRDGRTVDYEFTLVTADSTGIVMTPFPRGNRSPHGFRLTRLAADTAVFEAPEHDYPKRIIYARTAAGLTARSDGGADDANPRIWPLTPAACTPVTGALAGMPGAGQAPAAPRGPERNGRTLLYVTQTLNGLWLGVAIPAMFNADDPTPYGLGLLLGAPAGIFFARVVDTSQPVSLGHATAIAWGGWWGWWNGLGLYGMGDDYDETVFFRNTVIGLVGGTAVGTFLARRPIEAGDASLVAHASVWGTWYGAVVTALADAGNDDGWKIVLGAGNAALLGAALATPTVDVTAGRVWVTTASGIAGLVAGLGMDLIVQTEDDKAAVLIPAITSTAGLAAGWVLSRGLDRREARGPAMVPEPTLLGVRDGRARLGFPLPRPAMVPQDDGRTRRWVPGMRMTLFAWSH
jgi:hypothetical protein